MKEKTGSKTLSYAILINAIVTIGFFATNYPSYALSPIAGILRETFSLSNAQYSQLFSSAMIPGFVLGIISGLLCDKYGAKKSIGFALIVSGIASVIRIFASSYAVLYITLLFGGFGCTFFNCNISKIIGSWFPREKTGVGIGIALAGANVAQVVAMATTALLPGYKVSFVIGAVLIIFSTIIWLLFFKNCPDDAQIAHSGEEVSFVTGLKAALKSKNIWFGGIATGLVLSGEMYIIQMLPQALQTVHGLSEEAAGVVSSFNLLGNLCGAVFGPIVCARIGKTKPFFAVFGALAAIGTAFAWLCPKGVILTGALFLTGFVITSLITTYMSIPVMLPEIGHTYAGTGGGVMATIDLTMSVFIPSYIVVPIIGDNYRTAFLVMGIITVCTLIFSMQLPELMDAPEKK
ncbi:MAG: MFS transporter [Oscillospiraceae bacterium]|nr:MFS transporter [Oscillospiraceae bacterium]